MKTLSIIRHAKSSWDQLTQNDFDRPLNDRGKKDAAEMPKRLIQKKFVIDRFISSPAKRARKTALAFAKEYGRVETDIVFVPSLYHAPPAVFTGVIEGIEDDVESVAIFSHNPGITAFVNSLTSTQIDDMPTCGVFVVSVEITSWRDFVNADKHFKFFEKPKSER